MEPSDAGKSLVGKVGYFVVAPLIVAICGGLAVEYLKPGRNDGPPTPSVALPTPQAPVTPPAMPPVTPPAMPPVTPPVTPRPVVNDPDSWMQLKWVRTTEKHTDVLLPAGNGRVLNRMTDKEGKAYTLVYNPSGKKDGGLVPDRADSECEKVRFISMNDKELLLSWHFKSKPGIFAPYPAYEVLTTYTPYAEYERQQTNQSIFTWLLWIALGAFVLGFVPVFWVEDNAPEKDKENAGLVMLGLWGIGGLALLAMLACSFILK